MKFAQYLHSINRDCPVEWQDKFLKYKLLKKLLKNCTPEQGDMGNSEARFFDELRQQLQAANRHFACNADKIIRSYHGQHATSCCWWPRRQRTNQRKQAELATRAYWCRKYAKANAVALRKILKKHDKWCRNGTGKQFLQECWRSDAKSGVGLFLHSPLLDELKAIQDVLQAQMPSLDADLVERGPPPPHSIQPAAAKQQQEGPSPALAAQLRLSVKTSVRAAESHEGGDARSFGSPGSSVDCATSYTSPSLRHQRQQALEAIVESPSCMLNTGDIDWCPADPGSPGTLAPHLHLHSRVEPACGGSGAAAAPVAGLAGSGEAARKGLGGKAVAEPLELALTAGGPLGQFEEDELKCPICLDVMYKPVGLGCGHRFCRQCALEAAGLGRAVGTFHNIITHVPRRSGCPQCRQTGVYQSAVALREVGRVIQTRFPEDWAVRRVEEKQRNKQLSALVTKRQRQLLQSRTAFEQLFAI